MAMTLLRNRLIGPQLYLLVHLDDAKTLAADDPRIGRPGRVEVGDRSLDLGTLAQGSPDPDYLRGFVWPSTVPAGSGLTATAYKAMLKAETKLLCDLELARLADDQGAAQTGEGQAL